MVRVDPANRQAAALQMSRGLERKRGLAARRRPEQLQDAATGKAASQGGIQRGETCGHGGIGKPARRALRAAEPQPNGALPVLLGHGRWGGPGPAPQLDPYLRAGTGLAEAAAGEGGDERDPGSSAKTGGSGLISPSALRNSVSIAFRMSGLSFRN